MNILASILKLARRFPFFGRLYRRMRLKMFGWMQQVESALNPIDLVTSYSFTMHRPYGEAFDARKTPLNTVNWVVPDFAPGSGGHINIFRLIGHLERMGYDCRIFTTAPCRYSTPEAAAACIREHFNPLKAGVTIGADALPPAAITVATSWHTAYPVRNFRTTLRKCYFIQDFEPFFYPVGTDYAMAEQTYRFGMHGITAGQWLTDMVSSRYGMASESIGFSFDRELYRPMPRKREDGRLVFFYCRPVTPRRGFELGVLSLSELARQLPGTQFVLAGWDASNYKLPFPYLNAGSVALKDLAKLYAECDLALVISFTNLSLLPLELMACGCPVVTNRGANVEWLLNDRNSALADATPEALSAAMLGLLKDDAGRRRLSEAGIAFANSTSWEAESAKVAAIFERLTHEK